MTARLLVVLVASVALMAIACVDDAEPPIYLAIGDSLSVGIGASDSMATGFVPLVLDALDAEYTGIELRNVAVSGETTGSLRVAGQLDAAVALLRTRNANDTSDDDVAVITISIGGNDITGVTEPCLAGVTAECQAAIATALGTFAVNFDAILSELRAAAGPDTHIVAMTYYNAAAHPDCGIFQLATLAEAVLEGAPELGLEAGLNDLIRGVAAQHGVAVAETHGLVGVEAMQPDCRHANDAGYAVIATQFSEAIAQ